MNFTNSDCTSRDRLAYSVGEASAFIGLGRTTLYSLMESGQLRFCKIGKRRIIRSADLNEFLTSKISTGGLVKIANAEPGEVM